MADADAQLLLDNYERLRQVVSRLGQDDQRDSGSSTGPAVLPSAERLDAALAAMPQPGQPGYLQGRGAPATLAHLLDTVAPALNGQNVSGRYYGFVTGGTLPVAEAADNVVSALDQNLHVHLPRQTAATAVEAAALLMLVHLFRLDPAAWTGRLLTTGATASNVVGLALAREAAVRLAGRVRRRSGSSTAPIDTSFDGAATSEDDEASVAKYGLLGACRRAGVTDVRILTSMAHSSLYKAASIVGLGRDSIVELPHSEAEPWRLNLRAAEEQLAKGAAAGAVHIISVSAGEINTGRFATTGRGDMARLRTLADHYGAWIHVDAAFGLFARVLPVNAANEFGYVRACAEGLELADSIASDGHKLLNVPYDAGIFFSRHRHLHNMVFQNANAAYLTAGGGGGGPTAAGRGSPAALFADVPSPMDMGIENSRRFRALPVYAVLLSEGRDRIAAMLARMVRLARAVQKAIRASPHYGCLGEGEKNEEDDGGSTFIGVLFWAHNDELNRDLATRINATGQMYVSPTAWQGRPACRVAVSSWRVDVEADSRVVANVLESVAAQGGESELSESHKMA